MGAAPRYCGSRLPCRFTDPMGGIFQTTSGSILNATTICRSACNAFNASKKSGFFNFSGCSTCRLFATAYFFTALCCISIPRPAGLSGAVITPTILQPAFTNASSDATANSGVPMNTIFISEKSLIVLVVIKYYSKSGYNKYFFLLSLKSASAGSQLFFISISVLPSFTCCISISLPASLLIKLFFKKKVSLPGNNL